MQVLIFDAILSASSEVKNFLGICAQPPAHSSYACKNLEYGPKLETSYHESIRDDEHVETNARKWIFQVEPHVVPRTPSPLKPNRFNIPGSIGIIPKQSSLAKAYKMALEKLKEIVQLGSPFNKSNIKIVQKGAFYFAVLVNNEKFL